MNDDTHKQMLRIRGVEVPCETCRGYGVKTYSSGATWRGGMGTTSSEKDVCNACWGSGDANRSWLNLKTCEADAARQIAEQSLKHLCTAAGSNMSVMRPALEELIAELERMARGRKARPPFFVDACLSLVSAIKRGV